MDSRLEKVRGGGSHSCNSSSTITSRQTEWPRPSASSAAVRLHYSLNHLTRTGNLGTAILKSLLNTQTHVFTHYIACVGSDSSKERLRVQFPDFIDSNLSISVNDNFNAIKDADVVILALDPSLIRAELSKPRIAEALDGKLIISVAAGWTVQGLEDSIYQNTPYPPAEKPSIIRTLPNIAAQVSQSLTAIEVDPASPPREEDLALTESIFSAVGKTLRVPPSLIDATTAVAGSTPAMFAVLVDAMIDAAVAVGVPREMASGMVLQAMRGSAEMMQGGVTPAQLRDQGTSPEGCTIGGLMVMEERGVRGGVGRALREAVSISRAMDGDTHVNDTR